MDDVKKDLPVSMMIAAFTGISWYIGIEINVSLFLLFKRRKGVYFWSCALGSWGIILQPLFIILADFGVWKDPVPSIVMIYLTWLIMVVPQSWVLYSRLHLLMDREKLLQTIKVILIFNSIVFSIPTIVIGTIAQATTINPKLSSFNIVWDRVQLVVFFVQETTLSILYIFRTRKFLQRRAPLRERSWSIHSNASRRTGRSQSNDEKDVLWHLLYANAIIIALDIVLLGIQCADFFHLQGAFKPCVYGLKLKLEFVILNRLIETVKQPNSGGTCPSNGNESSSGPRYSTSQFGRDTGPWGSQAGVELTEENGAVQLVDSIDRKGLRSPSAESQAPFRHR